jgi:hypothetical protein
MSISSVSGPTLYSVPQTAQPDPVSHNKDSRDAGVHETKPVDHPEVGGTPGHLNIKV